jgi:SAM-dependent methyltransferase
VSVYPEPNNKTASNANAAHYNELEPDEAGAPHLVHQSLKEKYAALIDDAYHFARSASRVPEILDLGAGDGFATLSFLKLGAKVTAVDISDKQLAMLSEKAFAPANLIVACQDVFEALTSMRHHDVHFDVVVASSFLHHIPDYCQLLADAIGVLRPHGEFLSFQDPLRYSTLGVVNRTYSATAYFSTRLLRPDFIGGFGRFLRRSIGSYRNVSADNVEYHVVRDGVDQDLIREHFEARGFKCEIVRCFSTPSILWQKIGESFGFTNTFAVVAKRELG